MKQHHHLQQYIPGMCVLLCVQQITKCILCPEIVNTVAAYHSGEQYKAHLGHLHVQIQSLQIDDQGILIFGYLL